MYQEEFKRWLAADLEDPDLKPELSRIEGNDDEIKERFAVALKFGTAGLRGVLGAGTNRMNIYVIRQATQGLANWVKTQGGTQTVAISYDSRLKSDVFAKTAAGVLAANGIKVRIYDALMPVPALSFATRYYQCNAGVMVTASHNPAKYNGYKAYGPDGCQMTDDAAAIVYEEIQKTDVLTGAKYMSFAEGVEEGLIRFVGDDCKKALYEAIESRQVRPGLCSTAGLKLVYSPLNGSGLVPVTRVLKDIGITDITIVPEQEYPNGYFTTCSYPNPEIFEALELGLMFTLVLPYAIYAEEEGTVTPQTEETNTQEQVKEKENNAELSNIKSIDVTKPVIEDINFEAGKTFEVGEEVPISIKAYDAESGIDFVKINIYYTQSDDDNYYNGSEITLVYNEVTKLYEGKIPVINGGYDKALINRIYAVDKNHNLTEIYESEKYYFLISGGENNNLKHSKVESLEFKENGQTLTDKDQVHISITVPEEDSKYFSSINLEFYNKEKERYSSLSCHKVGDSNVYESYDSLLYFYGGHWVLNEIYAHDEERIDISYDKMDTIFFDYKGDKDEENPKIESIVMDKQGEFVKPGDDIQIHIKVSDNLLIVIYSYQLYLFFNFLIYSIFNIYHHLIISYYIEKNC